MNTAVKIENLGFSYDMLGVGQSKTVLSDINLSFSFGELALVCGPTGSGKSTLLKILCGLTPKFTGGDISGTLKFGEPETQSEPVGYVSQNPETSFVADRVSDEIVFGMEQLGYERREMQERLADVANRLGLQGILESDLANLSSGQKQRVAIAAALAAGQRILLLDEPTSSLDAESAAATTALLRELADSGLCVIVVEHRFDRLLDVADSLCELTADGGARALSIADARAAAASFATAIESPKKSDFGELLLRADGVSVKYRDICAVSNASLKLHAGEVVGLYGPNGSGKSSLLWALEGTLKSETGKVWRAESAELALVPCPANDLLFLTSVAAELAESDRFAGKQPGTTADLLSNFVVALDPDRHPRDLSAGQQLALALAVQLAKGRRVVLLDEPTSGLDYAAKIVLARIIQSLADAGHGILIASHDETFLRAVCTRMAYMDAGRVS